MENEKMKKTLEAKILEEVTPEDICDFWAEMVNGYIKVDHTHTGKVSLDCFDGFDVYDSIEDAAKDCVYTIVEWVIEKDDFALEWLEENGIDLEAIEETASAEEPTEEEEEEEEEEEVVLEISRIAIKTETFCTPWEGQLYCIDVCEDSEERSAWLYNSGYGIKMLMFGEEVKNDRKEFLDAVFSSLPEDIELYRERYEDVETDAEPENAFDFEKVEPTYTGGGIYIFSGKLADGNYFLADGDMFDVSILDADAYENWEECFYAEWQEAHIVKNLSSAEALEFFKSMLTWIRVNEPKDCNYDMHDMDRIEEDLNECILAEEEGREWR